MITPKDVQSLVDDMVAAKVLNADVSIKEALAAAARSQGLAKALEDSSKGAGDDIKPQWYVAGGSSYVLVCA